MVGDPDFFYDVVAGADAVFVATGARSPILTRDTLLGHRRAGARSLLLADGFVPRNVALEARRVPGRDLVNGDPWPPEAGSVAHAGEAAAPHAEALMHRHVEEFTARQASSGARAAFYPFREVPEAIRVRKVAYAAGKSDRVQLAGHGVVGDLPARPMTVLCEGTGPRDLDFIAGAMRRRFTAEHDASFPSTVT